LCTDAIYRAPLLSSCVLQWTIGVADWIGKFKAFFSFGDSIVGIASLNACDNPVHSLSVELRAISVCD
jgi:hypothetical protein